MAMKRLGAGEVYSLRNNDDVMLGVICDKKFREEHEQQTSGALARMQARCDNALRFMPEVRAVRQRREMAEAMLKGSEQND